MNLYYLIFLRTDIGRPYDKIFWIDMMKFGSSNKRILKNVCKFCDMTWRSRQCSKGDLDSCDSIEAKTKIMHAGKVLHDNHLLLEVGQTDFVGREVRYHHTSCKEYLNEAKHHEHTHLSYPLIINSGTYMLKPFIYYVSMLQSLSYKMAEQND